MKTTIAIYGQIAGNTILKNAISCDHLKNAPFNGYYLVFETKKEAEKALWDAFKNLRREEPESKHGISYTKKYAVTYDASTAKIIPFETHHQ